MGDMNMSGKRELMEYVPNYIVYDLETTGFSCNYDKIIEIAAIKVEGGKLADEFSALVNPERSIPYDASSVNGITDNMVKDAPKHVKENAYLSNLNMQKSLAVCNY